MSVALCFRGLGTIFDVCVASLGVLCTIHNVCVAVSTPFGEIPDQLVHVSLKLCQVVGIKCTSMESLSEVKFAQDA
jgi:hypothetical protein